MSETIFVTGATGLAGANICKLLIQRGDTVRALARPSADVEPLVALGIEICRGDVTDADDVRRAATGADAAIHCAALLGGASQNLPDFEAVNVQGTKHVLDAAEALGMRRVVALSTGTFFDTAGGLEREDAPVIKDPSPDPYTITKMAAFQDAMGRGCCWSRRGHHPSGRHLRAVSGGEQCPGSDQLQSGPAVCPAQTHRAVSDLSGELGLCRRHRPRMHSGLGSRRVG